MTDTSSRRRVPNPPRPATATAALADLDRRRRVADRRQPKTAPEPTGHTFHDNIAGAAAPPDTDIETTFYPPAGVSYAVTCRANADNLPEGAVLSLRVTGQTTDHRHGRLTSAAGRGTPGHRDWSASVYDIDTATTKEPLHVSARWTSPSATGTADIHFQFISMPMHR